MSTNRPTTEPEDLDRDPFEELASEFVDRYRNGELPSIEEYALAHPDLAEEIRELFPTIAAMERAKSRSDTPAKPLVTSVDESLPIQQLGDFRLLGEIGRGGMGIVYEAEQISLGRHVAVKVLPKQALLDERHLRRFEREAQTAAKLHHTNIVPVFGVGQQDGFHYIVMQFIPGVGLDEVLLALRRLLFEDTERLDLRSSSTQRISHANHNAQGLLNGNFGDLQSPMARSFVRTDASPSQPTVEARASSTGFASKTEEFSTDDLDTTEEASVRDESREVERLKELSSQFYLSVAKVGEQVADALAYAHEQGTLHRDIKPGNLLLDSSGTVWVADFGLAKFVEQDNVSRTGDIVGTLSYIPPESFSGPTDARGDIYSLGLSLFELLTLRPAFFGRDRGKLVREITEGNLPKLSKLNPNVPRDLETIVLKAIAHRPEDRYATAAEFASDLNCFLNDQPIQARRMSVSEQFARWYRKNKLVAALSAAVLSLLMVLTVVFGVAGYQARLSAEQLEREIEQKDVAKKAAEEAAEDADRQRQQADRERQKARDLANDSIQAVERLFAALAPMNLPVTAGATLSESDPLREASYSSASGNAAAQEVGENGNETNNGADLVAAPPINQETAARLEILLGSLESLAEKAENYSDFAATFADLTLRVGILHKALGNNDRALVALDRAISRYQSVFDASNAMENAIGLAVCYNEKAELLGSMNEGRESGSFFRQARRLLEKQLDQEPDASARAQYELARTMFLMSIQRENRPERSPRRSRPPRRWGRFGGEDAEGNLLRAIDLLKPLVETESNPEYTYLLARCYSALGSVAKPENREDFVRQANEVLQQLVESKPNVDDYKYEFAIAKLRRALSVTNLDRRLKTIEEAVALLDGICGRNPDVFNYQVARSRALDRYVSTLDRFADQLETLSEADENVRIMGQIARNDATDEATRAAELFTASRERFGDAFVDRLSNACEVEFAEVIAKHNSEAATQSAISYFRDVADSSSDFLTKARAEIGLARSLFYTDFREAYRVLDDARTRLYESCQEDIKEFHPNSNERFLNTFALWAEATMVSAGDFETAKPLIDELRQERLDALESSPNDFASFALPIQRAELDMRLANVYAKVNKRVQARELLARVEADLMQILKDEETSWEHIIQKSIAAFRLRDLYFEQGREEDVAAVERTMSELRSQLPDFSRERRRRRPPRDRSPGE